MNSLSCTRRGKFNNIANSQTQHWVADKYTQDKTSTKILSDVCFSLAEITSYIKITDKHIAAQSLG